MRRFSLFSASVIMFILFVNVGFSFEDGNTRKGKFLYRKNCRTCHGATASDLSPLSKTQAEWKNVAETYEKISCASDWAGLSESERNDILAYLYTFAKDSPTPAKCE